MARDAIYRVLKNDSQLAELGGDDFVVLPNFSGDQRPNNNGAFIVIRWGYDDFDRGLAGPHHFDLWVHMPASVSTDYVRIDNMIDRCDEIFVAANDTNIIGGDGRILNAVQREGRSRDLVDQGYETICRRASYAAYYNLKGTQ